VAWRSVKVEQFEQVMAAPSMALLRVTSERVGRWSAAPAERLPAERPTLVADDSREVSRFTALPALPSPPDPHGVLRASYWVPAALVNPRTVFSLELGDGHVVPLPVPARTSDAQRPAPSTAEAAIAGDALLQAAAALDQSELLEQRNAELGESLREQRATLAELEVWRSELERRLASMSTELGDARGRLREAEQELGRARAELAEAEARAATAEARAATAEARAAALAHDAESGAFPAAPPADGAVDVAELSRRAAAEASERAARELAEADAEHSGADRSEPESRSWHGKIRGGGSS
jgi:hypothetical protein